MTRSCAKIRLSLKNENSTVCVGAFESFRGPPGPPGMSPDIQVTKTDRGHLVTVVDSDGTERFEVLDGLDGGLEPMTQQDLEEIMG